MVVKRAPKAKPEEPKTVEALLGVLKIIQSQARQRAKLAAEPERGWYEWVVSTTESALR